MEIQLDKNGQKIQVGQSVVLCGTIDDYYKPKLYRVSDEFFGKKMNQLILIADKTYTFLSKYRNGDTDYHSVEIQ